MAELAASAAPVLLVLLLRPVVRRQAEMVERLTAHLTVHHLMLAFAGTEQTNTLGHDGN